LAHDKINADNNAYLDHDGHDLPNLSPWRSISFTIIGGGDNHLGYRGFMILDNTLIDGTIDKVANTDHFLLYSTGGNRHLRIPHTIIIQKLFNKMIFY
jgi:hypothetical protein